MSSLHLPPPTKKSSNTFFQPRSLAKKAITNKATTKVTTTGSNDINKTKLPTYEERCMLANTTGGNNTSNNKTFVSKFVPRTVNDYGIDGGSYPEIHVAQYPRNMGNPHIRNGINPSSGSTASSISKSNSSGTGMMSSALVVKAVEINKDGKISYDSIVTGGTNQNKLVYTKVQDIQPHRNPNKDDIAIPTREEELEEAERTNNALMSLLGQQINNDKPRATAMIAKNSSSSNAIVESKTQFIKYSAKPDAPGYNPNASNNRVVQIVQAQLDPLMPPKHKHFKAPRGPAEDPVPILQSTTKIKLSKEEQDLWNVPACISNWKNARGYTIPLDKRLAADGRGLIDNTVNADKFANLSESLYIAEQQARQEIKIRSIITKKQLLHDRATREEELRQLANTARLQRGGATIVSNNNNNNTNNNNTQSAAAVQGKNLVGYDDSSDEEEDDDDTNNDESKKESNSQLHQQQHDTINNTSTNTPIVVLNDTDDTVAAKQRDKLRIERKREREKELRIERNIELKKKQKFEQERDISEKIALGIQNNYNHSNMTGTGGTGTSGDGSTADIIDSRLYSTTSGLDSGFGPDDEYSTYTKPLFGNTTTSNNYRPTRNDTNDYNDTNADEQYDKLRRTAPVQFEKDTTTTTTTTSTTSK